MELEEIGEVEALLDKAINDGETDLSLLKITLSQIPKNGNGNTARKLLPIASSLQRELMGRNRRTFALEATKILQKIQEKIRSVQ
jgi:hypothetical protein